MFASLAITRLGQGVIAAEINTVGRRAELSQLGHHAATGLPAVSTVTRDNEPGMVTGELKAQVDAIWDAFWSGGVANPTAGASTISARRCWSGRSWGCVSAETLSPDEHAKNNLPDALARWSQRNVYDEVEHRLFGERLELVLALDAHGDAGESERALRQDTAGVLHEQVAGMNPANFLVRPHRRLVEHYSERPAWDSVTSENGEEVAAQVADLPTSERDDEAAKRFDLLMLGLQLRRLRPEPGEERLRRQVREIAAGLLEQTTIPVIREQEELAGEEWWVDVTLPMLEHARRRVRSLVRLLEKRKRAIA